jgi:hypothetical protein
MHDFSDLIKIKFGCLLLWKKCISLETKAKDLYIYIKRIDLWSQNSPEMIVAKALYDLCSVTFEPHSLSGN